MRVARPAVHGTDRETTQPHVVGWESVSGCRCEQCGTAAWREGGTSHMYSTQTSAENAA